MQSTADAVRSPRASTHPRTVRRPARRLGAAALAFGLAAALLPATAATAATPATTAEETPRGWIAAPGLTLLVGAQEAPGGTVAPPSTGAAFTAPANTDFRLLFDASVDPGTRQVMNTAAGIWSAALTVRVPIEVEVTMRAMEPGMLGAAGPVRAHFGEPSFPRKDVLYPVALANQLAGTDLDPGDPDIGMELSSTMVWDRAVDGTVSPTGQSMLSVAVHELAHGLGHTSWVRSTATGWAVNYLRDGVTLATPFDRLVTTATGSPITTFADSQLTPIVASPLQWAGAAGRAANGGTSPRLYSPPAFELGSSIGHLDESTFRSEVMTPFLARGEVHTAVPPITRAMLADIGWPQQAAGTPAPPGGTTAPPSTATAPTATAAQRATAYVNAVAQDFVGRPATSAELTRWRNHLVAGGSRQTVAQAYAWSDEWIGVLVDGLYRSTLGRAADPGGRTFWIGVLRSGQTPAQVAAQFYASAEYFRLAGGTATAWIGDLYTEILGRAADGAGLAFWVGRAASMPRTAIAFELYQSLESRRDRVAALFDTLLGRAPDPSGWSYWAGVLSNGRDLDLAVFLASSEEYHLRSTS